MGGRPGTLGVGVIPMETRLDVISRLATHAESEGYAAFRVAEGWGWECFSLLGNLAARTSRIELGVGVASVWSRSAGALAMAATTLQEVTGGRFALGLGASSPPLVEGLHDLDWESPLQRLRSVTAQVRALLDGDRIPLSAPDGVRPLRLAVSTSPAVRLEVAGMAPGSVRLAGEFADAWVPWLWPRDQLDRGRELIEVGRAASGAVRETDIRPSVPLAVAEDAATARRLAADWLTTYLTRMGPLYPRMLRRLGWDAAVDAMLAEAGDDLPDAAEPLADALMVYGTFDHAPDAIRSWLETGADGLTLVTPAGPAVEQLEEMVSACAPADQQQEKTLPADR